MASFGLYAGNEVTIKLGIIDLKDMRADTFINVRADEESFGVIKGSDGSVTRYATHNTLMHVDVTLKRSSAENAKLSALHQLDRSTAGGAGVTTFLMKDANGTDLLGSSRAWISGFTEASPGKDLAGDVTWTITMQVLEGAYILGGNQL